MPAYTTLLEEALEAWQYTREGVIEEVRNIPDRALAFRPRDESRTVRELAHHVIESGLLMSGELSRPDGDFTRKSYEALLRQHRRGVAFGVSKREIVGALRASHRRGAAALRNAGELHMLQHIRRFDGLPGTRFAWMNHGIAHEEYHRGQLALYARLLGRVPALTRRILGT